MSEDLKHRIASHIREYDGQGIHRTGTDVDLESANWLADKIEEIGLKPQLQEFPLSRIDIIKAELTVGDQRLEGVPLFDCARYTDQGGIKGTLGDLENDNADIGVSTVPPWSGHEYAIKFREARKRGNFKTMVSVTIGPSEGLFLLNAEDFLQPIGPPVLQVSSKEGAWLKDATKDNALATVVVHSQRVSAKAFNVVTEIKGMNGDLQPLVVMTPRSGWWQCASERGGGIAAWLEIMRYFNESPPERDIIFTANSGHELHHLGMDYFLDDNPGLLDRAHIWLHLGANFAARDSMSIMVASDEETKDTFFASIGDIEFNTRIGKPFGEAIPIYENGGRFISIGGSNSLFHAPEDLWPDAVDLDKTTRLVEGLIDFSKQLVKT